MNGSDLMRSKFAVGPVRKTTVEDVLKSMHDMIRLQALQISCLTRCVGQERFDAELKAMATEKPPEVPG